MNRRLKQVIYASAYLVILALIVSGIYFFTLKPGPSCFDGKQNGLESAIDCGGACVPCAEKLLSPLSVSWGKYFFSADMTTVAVEIKNSNINYGADYFDYQISIIGKDGEKIAGASGNSFIYAGEIKHILEVFPISIDPERQISIETEFSNMKWKTKEEFPKPQIESRNLLGKLREAPPTIQGVINNQSAFPLSRIAIFGFVYNDFGLIAAASKTEAETIPAFGEKNFIVNFPRDLDIEAVNPDNFKIFIEAKK